MLIRPVAAVVAVVLVLLGTGCGSQNSGAGGGATVTTSSLSKATFVKRATAICNRERANMLLRLAAYYRQHRRVGESSEELFADTVRAVLLPTIERELSEIQELGAPAGDEDQVEAFLKAEQRAVDSVEELQKAKSRFDVERHFAAAAKLAAAYGIPSCGNDSQATG